MSNAMRRNGIEDKLGRHVNPTTQKYNPRHRNRWQWFKMANTTHRNRARMPTLPHLFLVATTVVFEDARSRINRSLETHRTPGTDFDEVTYGYDTVCFSTDTKTNNLSIKGIEGEGFRYGLKLNTHKWEFVTTHPCKHTFSRQCQSTKSQASNIPRM